MDRFVWKGEFVGGRYYPERRDGLYRLEFHDPKDHVVRRISASVFRRTQTYIDPERADKRYFDEAERTGLKKSMYQLRKEAEAEEVQ